MSDQTEHYLVEVETGRNLGPISGTMGDLEFPPQVGGWTDVLDCRHDPYSGMELEELRHFAEHVRKYFVLVDGEKLSSDDTE